MKELQECLDTVRKIKDIEEKLYEMEAAILAPKNQIITDMPRGGGGENSIELFVERKGQLQDRIETLKLHLENQWRSAKKKLHNMQEDEIFLLHNRFVKGLSWEKSAAATNERYGKWNVNKAFRTYRKTKKEN